METKQPAHYIAWNKQTERPDLYLANLTPGEIQDGFQAGDQFIGYWTIFTDKLEAETMLAAIHRDIGVN